MVAALYAQAPGTALVVAADAGWQVLERLLEQEGYRVLVTDDGSEAVSLYQEHGADLVLLDAHLPGTAGLAAARRIKSLAEEVGEFVPVIFLTREAEEAALSRCVEAGGDDFVGRPFNPVILRAKVAAFRRIRALYRKVNAQREELDQLHGRLQREQEIAERIFTDAVTVRNVTDRHVRTFVRPAATFSGDLVLVAQSPDGGHSVLLGDFTGHGLAAAIGALPVSEIFSTMTAKGFAATEILREINRKLVELLPTGMFMAGCLVSLDPELRAPSLWNGGMPDLLLMDGASGKLRERYPSTHIPLGIAPQMDDEFRMTPLPVHADDLILAHSDGLTEARSPGGVQFGEQRLLEVVEAMNGRGFGAFDELPAAWLAFVQDRDPEDDVTVAMILCQPAEVAVRERMGGACPEVIPSDARRTWGTSLTLEGPSLAQVDPVPLLLTQMDELAGLGDHRQPLFTILAELYSNARDHGVLGMESSLKSSAEGFLKFYEERDRRLHALREGSVRIELEQLERDGCGCVVIRMEDSGLGFDYGARLQALERELRGGEKLHGRGIRLVSELCRSLRYQGSGNWVEAVYVWNP